MAGALAMVAANTTLADWYETLLATHFKVQFGEHALDKPLVVWVNDLLMAVFFRGLDGPELVAWTDAMLRSGDVFDFRHLPGGMGHVTVVSACIFAAISGSARIPRTIAIAFSTPAAGVS